MSTLKKGFSPHGSKFFPFTVDPFIRELVHGNQTWSHISCVPCTNSGKATTFIQPPLKTPLNMMCLKKYYFHRWGKCQCTLNPFEPAHNKTYNKTCATSEDSDQPANPCSLIRVFTNSMCLLQPRGCPKKGKGEPLPNWLDLQADLSLCWSNRSYCRFCHALAHLTY